MANTRKQRLVNLLKEKLNPYIQDYENHQKQTKNSNVIEKAFFDAKHYVSSGHGEAGYNQRLKLIKEAEQATDEKTLLATVKSFYDDVWNTGEHTRLAIRSAFLTGFNINKKMIDETAKKVILSINRGLAASTSMGSYAYPPNYTDPWPQSCAMYTILECILDNDLQKIEDLRVNSFDSENELDNFTSHKM